MSLGGFSVSLNPSGSSSSTSVEVGLNTTGGIAYTCRLIPFVFGLAYLSWASDPTTTKFAAPKKGYGMSLQVGSVFMRILCFEDQMDHRIRAIYHVLLRSQYCIWTIRPVKGDLVLKVFGLSGNARPEQLCRHNIGNCCPGDGFLGHAMDI